MKQKNNYQVIVGNVGTMDYTNKRFAVDCFKTYKTLSEHGATRAANEPVTLLMNGEIIDEYLPPKDMSNNLIAKMFDLPKLKEIIDSCAKDEISILCPHWSINKPKYPDNADPEQYDWDFTELEEYLGHSLYVNDFDDLIADPHGICNQ